MILSDLKESDKSNAVKTVIESSEPNKEFYIMVGLSVSLATIGFLLHNSTVVIGSMLIAPILHPFLSFSLGIATLDGPLVLRSLEIVMKSLLLSILGAIITTTVLSPFTTLKPELYVLSTLTPSYLQIMVGVIAGAAATFALVKENLSAAIPGVAISVALIPPLAAVGLSIAVLNRDLFIQSGLLFLLNIFGIVLASSLIFLMLDFSKQEKKIDKSLKKEEKELEEAAK